MNATARAYDDSSSDPALARLHEVTERIRRRAAEARARAEARGQRHLSLARPEGLQLTLALPMPRSGRRPASAQPARVR